MNDLTKLPKWAQQRIQTLERNVEHWKKIATTGPEDTNTFVLRGGMDDNQPVEKYARVKFMLGDRWDQYVECRITEDDTLAVSANAVIAVLPVASNGVHVKLVERW